MPSRDFVRSAQGSSQSLTQYNNNHFSRTPLTTSLTTSFTTSHSSYVPTGRLRSRITDPNSSHHGHSGVKCSIKANEGLLFCLDKSFMFVPKPATYVQIENISVITMSRVGGAISASRTFDITITLKGGMGEHQFSNINRFVWPLVTTVYGRA